MPKTAYIYVPAPSRTNLEIGLNDGLWGWRSSALDRAGAREAARRLASGDFLVLGHRGPNSRVAPGGWANATLQRVIVTQITRPLFSATEPVWPDDTYPERICIDVLGEESDVAGSSLGREAMEALRLSANKQGAAVVTAGAGAVAGYAASLPPEPEQEPGDDFSHTGDTNAVAQVLVRREQQKLRRALIRGRATTRCSFCGRTLPSRLVRAAHIKRRSQASRLERLDLGNIVPACLMGCDELFEHGYIYVAKDGTIAASPSSSTTNDLKHIAQTLAGRAVIDFDARRAEFFRWHREHTASISA
ncbi:hypothetical protein ACFYYM_19725 [Streptomyces erythrochromogenes]|uniref:hypothetical protein n=1 Tax=Streptomyces erythrochromogenes TaxID=285574 RepID=UPI0036A357A4